MRDTIAMAEAMRRSFIEAKQLRIEVFIKTNKPAAEIEYLRRFPVPVFKFQHYSLKKGNEDET